MPSDDEERDRAFKVAYTQGRRDAEVDAHLRSHENRLNAINGSIERHAREAAALKETVARNHESLDAKIDKIAAALATDAAVEEERVKQIRDANEKQISNRQFWLGVATICTMILVVYLAKGI